jgi:hypothetical protein
VVVKSLVVLFLVRILMLKMRDELKTKIVKAKNRARLKAMIPHPSKSIKYYQENLAHSNTLLCYKLYDAPNIFLYTF